MKTGQAVSPAYPAATFTEGQNDQEGPRQSPSAPATDGQAVFWSDGRRKSMPTEEHVRSQRGEAQEYLSRRLSTKAHEEYRYDENQTQGPAEQELHNNSNRSLDTHQEDIIPKKDKKHRKAKSRSRSKKRDAVNHKAKAKRSERHHDENTRVGSRSRSRSHSKLSRQDSQKLQSGYNARPKALPHTPDKSGARHLEMADKISPLDKEGAFALRTSTNAGEKQRGKSSGRKTNIHDGTAEAPDAWQPDQETSTNKSTSFARDGGRGIFNWRSLLSLSRADSFGSRNDRSENPGPARRNDGGAHREENPVDSKASRRGTRIGRSKNTKDKENNIFDHIGKNPADFESFVTSIKLHKTDRLNTTDFVKHPVVMVHVVDVATGKYLTKSSSHRPVTTLHEENNVDYILPVMSKEPKSLSYDGCPKWEDDILLNEEYLYVLSEGAMLLFEILELITDKDTLVGGQREGYRRIAWAFLKLVNANKKANVEQMARLQLFRYPNVYGSTANNVPAVYRCYQMKKRKKFPSTLYVTVYGREPLQARPVMRRPASTAEVETGKETLEELLRSYEAKRQALQTPASTVAIGVAEVPQWRRRAGQRCKLPNKLLFYIDPGQSAFRCAFSNDGLYIALACIGNSGSEYPIKIYTTLTGERVMTLEGHQNIIYQLLWSRDDCKLLSSSSDGSVRLWDVKGTSGQQTVLQHPSHVYTMALHPRARHPKLIATGSQDTIIRIWPLKVKPQRRVVQPTPLQFLRGHENGVNTLVFDAEGKRLYSADQGGIIRVWSSEVDKDLFVCIKTITLLQGNAITAISMHPQNRRLLVHLASSVIHTMDVRIYRILTTYSAAVADRSTIAVSSTYTACGSIVLAGADDGTALAWETDTGRLLGTYSPDSIGDGAWTICNQIVHVAYHPFDHIACFVELEGLVSLWTWDQDPDKLKAKPVMTSHERIVADAIAIEEKLEARKREVAGIVEAVRHHLGIESTEADADTHLPSLYHSRQRLSRSKSLSSRTASIDGSTERLTRKTKSHGKKSKTKIKHDQPDSHLINIRATRPISPTSPTANSIQDLSSADLTLPVAARGYAQTMADHRFHP